MTDHDQSYEADYGKGRLSALYNGGAQPTAAQPAYASADRSQLHDGDPERAFTAVRQIGDGTANALRM